MGEWRHRVPLESRGGRGDAATGIFAWPQAFERRVDGGEVRRFEQLQEAHFEGQFEGQNGASRGLSEPVAARRKAVQGLVSEFRRAVEQSCKTPGQKQGTSFGTAPGGRRVARRRAKPVGAWQAAGGRRDSTEVWTCRRPAGWSPATARPALPSCWPLSVRAGQHTCAPGAG